MSTQTIGVQHFTDVCDDRGIDVERMSQSIRVVKFRGESVVVKLVSRSPGLTKKEDIHWELTDNCDFYAIMFVGGPNVDTWIIPQATALNAAREENHAGVAKKYLFMKELETLSQFKENWDLLFSENVPLPDSAGATACQDVDQNYEISDADNRALIQQQIRERRGQEAFRNALLERYQERCVVTGCKVVAVLEAAHIRPYRGENDNHFENGLLLRADIHTLFDLNLLGIEPASWRIHVHPRIEQTYVEFSGKSLLLPSGAEPSATAVAIRFGQFRKNLRNE